MVKRILNTTTGKYYQLRQKTTTNGTTGQIMGLWSPKRKATVITSKRVNQKLSHMMYLEFRKRIIKERRASENVYYQFWIPLFKFYNEEKMAYDIIGMAREYGFEHGVLQPEWLNAVQTKAIIYLSSLMNDNIGCSDLFFGFNRDGSFGIKSTTPIK